MYSQTVQIAKIQITYSIFYEGNNNNNNNK